MIGRTMLALAAVELCVLRGKRRAVLFVERCCKSHESRHHYHHLIIMIVLIEEHHKASSFIAISVVAWLVGWLAISRTGCQRRQVAAGELLRPLAADHFWVPYIRLRDAL